VHCQVVAKVIECVRIGMEVVILSSDVQLVTCCFLCAGFLQPSSENPNLRLRSGQEKWPRS